MWACRPESASRSCSETRWIATRASSRPKPNLLSAWPVDSIFQVKAQAYAAINNYWLSLAVPGQSADLMRSAIYGPDGKDITVGDAPFNWNPDTNLSNLRIGFQKTEFEGSGTPPNSEQQRQLQEQRRAVYKVALDVLEKAGAKLVPIEMPKFSTASLRFILTAEAAAAFDDITRDGRVNELSGQNPGDWPNSFRTSRFIPAVEYIRAQRVRTLLVHEMEKLMSQWDVFVSPGLGSSSLLVSNLTGNPAICVPCGFANDRPVSIMFTGGVYDEVSPMRVALAFERATRWHTMHPKMDWT